MAAALESTKHNSMPAAFTRNTVLSALLTAAFYFYFQFSKHAPSLSDIIPFANDPYDALNPALIAPFILLLAFARTCLPHLEKSTARAQVLLARTQATIAIGVLMALIADLVAMVRHPQMWLGVVGTGTLVALSLGLGCFALIELALISHSVKTLSLPAPSGCAGITATATAYILVLALYPESLIASEPGELVTLAVCFPLFLIPLSIFIRAFFPLEDQHEATEGIPGRWRWLQWGLVTFVGLSVAFALLLLEAIGEGGIPLQNLLHVAAVYTGVVIAWAVATYILLRKPLGVDIMEIRTLVNQFRNDQ